jgi:hypothetical protein
MARKATPPLQGSFRKLGNEHAAMFVVQDREGIMHAFVKAMKAKFIADVGRCPHPDEEILFWVLVKERQEALEARVHAKGVPSRMAKLFASASKSDQQRALAERPLRGSEFDATCVNCETVGYRHEAHVWEFIPEHLEPTAEETDSIAKNCADRKRRRLLKKVVASFKERKRVVVHVFRGVNDGRWHILYFTLRDMFGDPETKKHHWTAGSHVHYLSHLYVRVGVDDVLRQFEDGDWRLPTDHMGWEGDA